VILNTLLNKGT